MAGGKGFKAKFRFTFCCFAATEITEEDDEKEDRISLLPDCLLTEILSRLPSTKHAIRTSSLSKRWKYLWTYVPTLILRKSDFKVKHWRRELFSSIDKTLAQCRQLKLKKFRLNSTYYSRFDPQISNWVRFALNCNVEELNLRFISLDFKSMFDLNESIFISSCLTNLNLLNCKLNPIGAISWKNLKTLYITRGKLDEDLIENILSGSPALETLKLKYCYGFKRLDITSKSVKNLVISGYSDHQYGNSPTVMEINAPYILSLTIRFNFYVGKFSLLNVSCLVKAHLDYRKWMYRERMFIEDEETLKDFILKLRHVNELKIGKSCLKAVSRLEAQGFIFPANMKFSDVIP